MYETSRAHQGRVAIRTFHVVAHAILLRGRYSLGGQSGQALEYALKTLSPEIYGSMNDPMRIELKGLAASGHYRRPQIYIGLKFNIQMFSTLVPYFCEIYCTLCGLKRAISQMKL